MLTLHMNTGKSSSIFMTFLLSDIVLHCTCLFHLLQLMPFTRAAVFGVIGLAVSSAFTEFTSTVLMFLVRSYRSRCTKHEEKRGFQNLQMYKANSTNKKLRTYKNLTWIVAVNRSECISCIYISPVKTDKYKKAFIFFGRLFPPTVSDLMLKTT